ncbi:MAG TPA: hypothetical protein VFS88_08275 [Micavibrio sp.]|jgi:hypothetical protein|nr:hypothetical protein [Micavibrio sp.]
MVYPVSNPLVQQQIPVANTFQPGGTDAAKRTEENKTPDSTRSAGTDTARSDAARQKVEERSFDAAENSRARDSGKVYSSASRGTQLDLTA